MDNETTRVLLVEDNPGDARLIEEMFRERSVDLPATDENAGGRTDTEPVPETTLLHADRLTDALKRVEETTVDLVLLDLGLPDSTGLETLETFLDRAPELPVVVLTGLDDEATGVRAVQQGAQSYLFKDELGGELLLRSVRHALERHERERQLTALTTLSRDLMAATTADEIAELAAAAASDVLEFPIAAVCLYDAEEGKLRPRAATDRASELLSSDEGSTRGADRIAPGMWASCRATIGEVFATNRAAIDTTADDQYGSLDPESPLASRIVLPLDAHGVFVLGSTDSAAVPSTGLDYARMLATNAQATLDRLARERQLRDREATLESQTDSLERLNRINAVIRDVLQSVVHATTRAEIEQAVCERLATAGPFRFVWIGEHDQLRGAVTPHASAGVEEGYLDTITATTGGDPADSGPVGRAASTREPQVVDDAVTDLADARRREAALVRGYRSMVSVPLEYSETLYGVLSVYADQPGLFEAEETAVLAELAETIAHAINAVESKRALAGGRVVELEFEVRDEQLFFVELTAALECSFEFESVVRRTDDRLDLYFSTRGAPVEAVLERVERTLAVADVDLMAERSDDLVFRCTLREPNLVSFCLEHGVTVQSLSADDGAGRAVFELANDAAVREFAERFQSRYPDTRLVASREHERSVRTRQGFQAGLEDRFTERQAEVLRTAFFSGYFESPRASSGRDVAADLDIAQSTLNQHLRSALRKLLGDLYKQ